MEGSALTRAQRERVWDAEFQRFFTAFSDLHITNAQAIVLRENSVSPAYTQCVPLTPEYITIYR